MEINETTQELSKELSCTGCGSVLRYKPGTHHLKCIHCGTDHTVNDNNVQTIIEEVDFETFIAEKFEQEEKIYVTAVKCESCGASITLKPNITSDNCPFCNTPLVITSGSVGKILKPKYLLPFKIEVSEAMSSFQKWMKKLWFAPNDLKKHIHTTEKLKGIYIPYWTYDSKTHTNYTGEQGIDYQHMERFTTTENGKIVTKTRTVTKTRWTYVSGTVTHNFDDVLVLASKSISPAFATKLEPWDFKNLATYNDKYLSGFQTESYQVNVKTGFSSAKEIMNEKITQLVKQDIGGDRQRISSINTKYQSITFKHILLPIWISSYRYKNKIYQFIINARTGKVQGQRPWSLIKVSLTVLAVIATIAGIVYLYNQN